MACSDLNSEATNPALSISLTNHATSPTVYAYITGLAIDNNYNFILLQSDGCTPYYLASPSTTGSPLLADCAIPLGSPGSSTFVTVPRIAGGRIWFSINSTLTFFLNPGPGLVEPSVSNQSDPNYNLNWSFCEFTYNDAQIFANISCVDFVGIPIALNPTNTSGAKQSVTGIPRDGLAMVVDGLVQQNLEDGKGWDKLVVRGQDGSVLRAMSPNTGIVMDGSLFQEYYDAYVNAVWRKYAQESLSVGTQAQCGVLAVGLNRSTLLENSTQPNGDVAAYYEGGAGVTNHYSWVVHSVNGDERGYAFPYDDVGASGASDLAGAVWDGSPQVLEVVIGGY